MSSSTKFVSAFLGLAFAAGVSAAPVTYEIDSSHTYPSFEADHSGGVSLWRGKINSSTGRIVLDKEAGSGTVEVTMDMKTIDFGHQGLNDHAQTPDIFDTAQFPTATYQGRLVDFRNGAPTAVPVTVGLDDEAHVEIVSGDIKPDDKVIVAERRGTSKALPVPRF